MTGIIILVMSVTGVLLTYEKQVIAWSDARALSPSPQARGSSLPIDSLVRLAQRSAPGLKASGVTVSSGATHPVKVSFGRDGVRYLDAADGAVLGSGNASTRKFLSAITAWHRWLGATDDGRDVARAITGASNLAFLGLVVSGFFLWFPRILTWTRVRAVLWFRGGLRGKARDFNWHHVLGIWSLVPLLLIVSSGVVISYRWAGDLVFRLAGEAPPAPSAPPASSAPPAAQGGPGGAGGARVPGGAAGERGSAEGGSVPVRYEPLIDAAAAKVPTWRTITIPLPVSAEKPVAVAIDAGSGGQPQLRSTLTLDATSAREKAWLPFAEQSAGRKARSFLRFAHTGEYYGLMGQTIAGLVTLATVVLVWTGIALALRRLAASLRRRDHEPRHRGLSSAA
ncbi:MAG: PepSY domain-containing protein [Gemmatimonadaceae bacterium]|nr:PepSY domain-containing protein [Gemmatimonadaceae bacterium]